MGVLFTAYVERPDCEFAKGKQQTLMTLHAVPGRYPGELPVEPEGPMPHKSSRTLIGEPGRLDVRNFHSRRLAQRKRCEILASS